jgi:phosphoribosylformylglycinamidine synthase
MIGFLAPKLVQQSITSCARLSISGLARCSFNNEFGRPNILGYFRTYEQATADGDVRGYHKPIMLAGGLGHIQAQHIKKGNIPVGSKNTKPAQTHFWL